jgi:non-reducing end alpha-L-arabinofuranosidase
MKKIRSVVSVVLVSVPVSLGAVALSCGGYTNGATGNTGGSPSSDGSGGSASSTGSDGSAGVTGSLPCDILEQANQPCVSAHSTVRLLRTAYTGPLYQVCKGTADPGPSSCKGTTQDIQAVNGYADAAAQESFCTTPCTVSKIYDQSGQGNDLEPAPLGGAKATPGNPARAADAKVTINGHSVYGLLFKPGMGYRTGCAGCNIKTGHGTATGDQPQTVYMVARGTGDLINGCCFDYGNAETSSNDDGNGTMEAAYLGQGVVWGNGAGNPPWVMADLENGLYPGWDSTSGWSNIAGNTTVNYDFVTALIVGDTADKNGGKGRFAVYGGDAAQGTLKTMYDGIRPEKPGYVPMQKQGSVILSTGGDNSDGDGGRFFEGAMANGAATKATVDALQASIVAAGYGK